MMGGVGLQRMNRVDTEQNHAATAQTKFIRGIRISIV